MSTLSGAGSSAVIGRLHGPEVVLDTLGGPMPYRAGDRVIIRETIRELGDELLQVHALSSPALHHGWIVTRHVRS